MTASFGKRGARERAFFFAPVGALATLATVPSAPRQLCFDWDTRPMRQAFSVELFKEIPKTPGVYLLKDEAQRILYVGQSRSLRTRLAYYRNAKAERVPRKILQLSSKVREIHWIDCDTPEDAELCELEMLRLHRPRFNVANAHPQNYVFVGLKLHGAEATFHRSESPAAHEPGDFLHGAFKNRSGAQRAILSITRICWINRHAPATPHALPSLLLRERLPKRMSAELNFEGTSANALFDEMLNYFSGESSAMIARFRARAPDQTFLKSLHETDCVALEEFFLGAKRNYELRQAAGISRSILHPAELNDLLTMHRAARKKREVNALAQSPATPATPDEVSSAVAPL